MKVQINNIILQNVGGFTINVCDNNRIELCLSFKENHEYTTLDEFLAMLDSIGVNERNYHFRGFDSYGNYYWDEIMGEATDFIAVLDLKLDQIHALEDSCVW